MHGTYVLAETFTSSSSSISIFSAVGPWILRLGGRNPGSALASRGRTLAADRPEGRKNALQMQWPEKLSVEGSVERKRRRATEPPETRRQPAILMVKIPKVPPNIRGERTPWPKVAVPRKKRPKGPKGPKGTHCEPSALYCWILEILYCTPKGRRALLRMGEVFAYVGSIQNLKDLKGKSRQTLAADSVIPPPEARCAQ